MAKDEIYNLLELDIDRDEHAFFSNILDTMHTHETDLGDVFKEHVVRDEKYFYNEKNNKFRMLWPELRWMIDGT